MSDFVAEINDIAFGTYAEDETQGDGLIRIQWRHGDPKTSTGGFFFLAKNAVLEGFAPGKPWASHAEYFEQSRTREDGWKAEALQICVICARAQPYLRGDKVKTWLDRWPKDTPNAAMHVDLLLIAEGLEELGPICWSTNGTKTAFAIIGRADAKRGFAGGILERLKTDILTPAGKLIGKDVTKQPWLFWVTVATERNAKGVVYTETPGKLVTLPVLTLPATVDRDWLAKAYAGKQMATYGEEMRALYDEWKQTRYTNDTPATNGKNRPQPLDNSDLPDPNDDLL